ncbi:ammonia monooxygenase [Streptococcus criceti]|uniref:Membrane protein n=1 Tax=Streptococcus criceti HS-6 TaxID=873449 RepID=G5JPA0_STRCG|nr:AbrB family transcriptional regulator [Streptococcus criceti]EHI73516.1 putative membrane protein [Streptococcus criceti HS-6]SUN41824.1 ammonia monooxygenase [Streptococcus criceti]
MILSIFLTLFIGLAGGWLARRLRIPAPFMVGSMIAVALVSILTGQMVTEPSMKIFAQVISGAYIGQQISKRDIVSFPKLAKAIAGLMSLFTLNMIAMGLLFRHFFALDLVTALLSCLPGGIVDVSLMSIDMGARSDIVATLQSARLIGILLLLPAWVAFLTKKFSPKGVQTTRQQGQNDRPSSLPQQRQAKLSGKKQWVNNGLILIVASLGGLIGMELRIPVGALIFSLIFSSVLKITRNTQQLSISLRYLAQIVAGSLIGTNFTQTSLLRMVHLIIPIVLLLTSYLIINAFFGFIMYRSGLLDLQSALFASSPAGATDISLLAGELGGDMPKIAGIQISRTVYTVVVMPLLVKALASMFSCSSLANVLLNQLAEYL